MDIEFQALLDNTLSEAAQEKLFASAVEQIKQEAKAADESILQRPVEVTTIILGTMSVELDFLISEDVLQYIAEQLSLHSPVGTGADKHPGLYAASNMLYADGVLIEVGAIAPQAKIYMFVNNLPYAEKIEKGELSQAPNGVYEMTANEAQKRFPSASIIFIDYASSGGVHPAIQVSV